MPGIGGIFKGVKAALATTAKGAPKGTYTSVSKNATMAKPGYTMLGGKVTENAGLLGVIQRNPKTTAAVAGLGGAYYMMG